MTARLKGGHDKAVANALRLSPEMRMLFGLLARLLGEKAVYETYAVTSVRTIVALSLCGYRYRDAAILLLGSDDDSTGRLSRQITAMRQQAQRIKNRILPMLRELSFSLPIRPGIEGNLERWRPEDFDEHAELSPLAQDSNDL